MNTILRVRDDSKPEPKIVLDCRLAPAGTDLVVLGQEAGASGSCAIAHFGLSGIYRHMNLPEDWGLPLDSEGRFIDCTPDAKSEVFKELLAACEAAHDLLRHYRSGKDDEVYMQLSQAIANAKAQSGAKREDGSAP